MTSLHADRAWPDGTLPAILEEFLYVGTVDPVVWPFEGDASVRVGCLARGPETVGDSGADIGKLVGGKPQRLTDGLARAVRETMYRQVEDAITAAIDAGWTLLEHPHLEMTGTIKRDRETGLEVPCAECRVTLHFCFRPPAPGMMAG